MKLGFDFRLGGVENAGLGRYSSALLFALLENFPELEMVVFYNPTVGVSDVQKLSQYSKVTLVKAPFRHYSFQEQFLFLKTLNQHKLDLMHFPNFNLPYFYNAPYVVTIHDVVHHKLSGHKKGRYYKFLAYKKLIERAVTKSKQIITISDSSKKDIIETLHADLNKISVVYEASSLKPLDLKDVERVKENFLISRPYFLFVGTLERKKNIPELVKGFELFLDHTHLDMDLVIAGKIDKHYPEIKTNILNSHKHNKVVFTGPVTDEEMAGLYQGAYAFVSASTNEGFGLPGVEAMSFGVPLVVANTPVFNEVYDNAALYFDANNPESIADNLALLANDTKFHAEQQQKSLDRGTMFSWDQTAKETYKIYEKIIQNHES